MTKTTKDNFKQALLSIVIGCSVAFLATLMEEVAFFLRNNSDQIVAGLVATSIYVAKAIRA
jgi:uncharacterized protein YcsI (UPF0317 family)